MSSFFHKTGVKVAVAILCIVCFTVACLSGYCVAAMLVAGQYDGSGSIYDTLTENQLSSDAWCVMQNYFDPSEPTKPWKSYYSGGIYTGENSNFRYNITDDETGYSVLATVEGGEPIRMKNQYHYTFDVQTEETVADRYTVDSTAFICDGVVYLYDEVSNYFYPLYDERVSQYLSDAVVLATAALEEGFTFLDYSVSTETHAAATEVAPIYEQSHYEFDGDGFYISESDYSYSYETKSYTITAYVLHDLSAQDNYRQIYDFSRFLTENRYYFIGLFVCSLIFGIVLLVILGCGAGHVKDKETPVVSPIFKLPTDVFLVADFFAAILIAELVCQVAYSNYFWTGVVGAVLAMLAAGVLVVYTVCMLAVRGKTHTFISGSFLYWCVKNARSLFGKLCGVLAKALGYMPLVWKVAVCYGALCILEYVVLMGFNYNYDGSMVLLWLLEKLVLGAGVAYVTLAFHRLKKGAESIAAGDYTTKISEEHLVLDFKDTAHTLNHIQGGMNTAVESRMKSERLKTELITNVSHDIKTPLTSIVSYVDLMKKEPMATENAKEYLEVLDRQSARLKKLVENLVEASKASTGNIAVHAEAMDLTVVLGQALGEYNERLLAASLTPVVKAPEGSVMVNADGRLLWRIFDNLLGNAVKYAMPGTRLYVSVTADTHAIVTIRNISREPLDVAADELMERFVRGDASRHTEGSGLGLSIAKSLTDSMGGEFLLSVDGDLFKAAVIFPLLPEGAESE